MSGRPVALLVPTEPGAMTFRVCGVSVLTRLLCSLDRAAEAVYFAIPDDFPAAAANAAKAEAEGRPTPARPQALIASEGCLAALPSVGTGGLLVATAPVVLDHRVAASAIACSPPEVEVVRVRRPGTATALWYVAPHAVPAMLQAVAGRSDLASALAEHLDAAPGADFNPGADLCETVRSQSDLGPVEEKLFSLGRKASDTWIAKVFDRRVSLWFTRRLVYRSITPNQVTLGSTAVGVVGGLLLAFGTYWAQLWGGLLLTFAIIIDGCDGELARIQYMESDYGRKLDFFLDNVVNVLAIFTVGAGHYWQGGPIFFLWASALNASAALGSVFPVYWLFFRQNKESIRLQAPTGPVAPAAERPKLLALAEDISGRDFAYMILALAVIGRAYWFTYFALFGLTAFFFLIVGLMAARMWRGDR